tara:strand:+ start:2300 stop:3235 length:936 start_codon:yes stop_codon:yes gene_type:complete
MRIAITGALGHIGSYTIRNLGLKNSSYKFTLIDNLLTQRYASLFNLPATNDYNFLEKDVSKDDIESDLDNIDILIHLAAMTDAANSFENPDELERNNLLSTENVANLCLKKGIRLIFLSSTSVYGTQKKIVAEDCSDDDLKPQSPYAETKLKEEKLINELASSGLKVVCCRFGTIFGISQGMRFHTAVNKFCWQAVMGQEITVWKTAYEQSRPYLDLKDASSAFDHIIKKDLFDGDTFNILTQNATVKNVIELIKEYIPNVKVKFVDSKIMNQLSYEVSSEKFKAEGFKFSGSLKAGIFDTINLLKDSNRV